MVKVCVKWTNKIYEDVVVSLDEPVSVLRTQLWTLTGVPPNRQTVMIKGLLKDDTDLSKLGIKEGHKVMLIGTAEGSELKAPETKTVFVEDLTPEERVRLLKEKKIDPLPVGINNLGTTCYLNSVLQFLASSKELRESVKKLPGNLQSSEPTLKLCGAFRDFFQEWGNAGQPVTPFLAVNCLRQTFPQFARKSTSGMGYMQQDAEECLSVLLSSFNEHMPHRDVENLFSFRMDCELRCMESDGEDEPVQHQTEHLRKLSCHIGNQLSPVDHLHQGVQLSLDETIEKNSPQLNRTVPYGKTSRIATLPELLTVHFVRFEWKKAHDLARTEAGRAKVCRKVNFGRKVDVFEFCSDALKKSLKLGRSIWMYQREQEAAARNDGSTTDDEIAMKADSAKGNGAEIAKPDANSCETTDNGKEVSAEIAAAITEFKNKPLPTGNYELHAVITHQGRSADVGHYVAWVRKNDKDEDHWLKFDDDKVTEHEWKHLDLSGGRSDYHIAILCLYKKCSIIPTAEQIKIVMSDETEPPSIKKDGVKDGNNQ